MTLSKQEESALLQVYDKYWCSYLSGDIPTLASLLSDDYTQIGSVEKEVFDNKKDAVHFIETTIDQIAGNLEMRNRIKKIEPADPFMLITEHCDLYVQTEGDWVFYARFRASSFLQKKEGHWRFIHQHSSIPDIRADEGENIATEKISRENIELRDAIKRRTIELEQKNMELAMEASLERVRTVAMGMKKPDDLPGICEVLFTELRSMGFSELRNAMINIHNDEKSTFINYDFSDEIGQSINHLNYTIHPVIEKQIKQIRSTHDAFSETVFSGQDLEDWKAFRKRIGEKDDPRMANIDALYYYFYSIGTGAIGISTFGSISLEKLEKLKRFRNVFEFAYRRYMDVAQAEEQARESQIELGLERVRARAMAMQDSGELSDLVATLLHELTKLDFSLTFCIINIYNEPDNSNVVWAANPLEGKAPESYYMKFEDYPFHHAMMREWKAGTPKFVYVMEGKEKEIYDDYLYTDTEFRRFPVEIQTANRALERYVASFVFSQFGGLQTVGDKPLSNESLDILYRFGKVFDQTYTRFLDLQKAEAQALEAVKRASVDRVRAEIASMRTTTDLDRITPLIWKELTILGVPFVRCGVFIMDEQQELIHTFLSTPDGKAIAAIHLPYQSSPLADSLAFWREKKIYLTHWNTDQYAEFANAFIGEANSEKRTQFLHSVPSEGIFLHLLPFLQGMLYVGNITRLEEGNLNLIQSVADAFSTAYARYEDFNKLEAAKQQVDKTLTDLKQAQSQLVQAEKMASLGELTAGIAHEIQNPLNFVNNFSEINMELSDEIVEAAIKGDLEEIIQLAADIKSNQHKISEHGKRADAIVKGMLQHSRSSSGVKELTDINMLADEYFRLSYHGLRAKDKAFNAKLYTDFDPSIGKIPIVPQDIGRVLLNLYTNAFYAVNEKSKEAVKGYEPQVSISTRLLPVNENSLIITVKDNGNGIPKKIMDKIFQPFFTTKPTGQGTGLGLSLSYDIVKAHGGTLTVDSIENEGSVFIIQLQSRMEGI